MLNTYDIRHAVKLKRGLIVNSIPEGGQLLAATQAVTRNNPTRGRIQSGSSDLPRSKLASESLQPRRYSRHHVQRYLRQLDRVTRHYIHNTLKTAEDIDAPTTKDVKVLAKNFRQNLRDTFLDAGRGNEFEPNAILPGISAAIIELTEGLRALRESESSEPAPISPTSPEEPTETPYETTVTAETEVTGMFEFFS